MKKSRTAWAILAVLLPASVSMATETTSEHKRKKPERPDKTMTVTATVQPDNIVSETLTARQLKRIGANDFGSIMRYQPLISAPFAAGGSGNGKSSFDRGGYTGYNIRGLDANRVSLDIDGIPLPDATGRSNDPTSGENTFGIGRDYIDPYLYGMVNISPGATQKNSVNNVVGGSVSFISKSPDSYLSGDKHHYFSYTSNFDTTDHSWHNGITRALGNETAKVLFAYSRRDGQQVRDNSDILSGYPVRWNSDAFLISGIYNPDENNQISGSVDFYHKSGGGAYPLWDSAGHGSANNVIGETSQKNISQRYSVLIKHEFMPENNIVIDKLESKIFYQQTHVDDKTFENQLTPLKKIWTTSDLNTKTYGLASEITKEYGINLLNYGVNFSATQSRRPFIQTSYPVSPFIDYSTLQPQGDSNTLDINLWLSDTITLDNFYILPGLKYSWHKIMPKGFINPASNALGMLSENELTQLTNHGFHDNQLLPSLTLMYHLNDNLNTYLKYKRGVSYPTTSQMYGVWIHPDLRKLGYRATAALLGNPDLKTETSNQFEWGLVGEAVSGVTLRGSVFYNSYRNFIGTRIYNLRNSRTLEVNDPVMAAKFPENISSLYFTENRDKAYIYGAELSGNINYGRFISTLNGLSTTLAIGYNQGKSKSAYSGDSWMNVDSVLPMKAIVSLAFDDPQHRYGASLTATFIRGKQAEDSYRQNYHADRGDFAEQANRNRKEYMRIPGFGTLDFAAYYIINKNISINAGIYNITDRKYWDYASNKNLTMQTAEDKRDIELGTAPGRTYQIGVTATF